MASTPLVTTLRLDLDSQEAGNNRPRYPKVDHYWFQVAHNSEPLALQGGLQDLRPAQSHELLARHPEIWGARTGLWGRL